LYYGTIRKGSKLNENALLDKEKAGAIENRKKGCYSG
jgi:hypothetical protein